MSQTAFTNTFLRIYADLKNKRSPGAIRQAIDEALVKSDCMVVARPPHPSKFSDPYTYMREAAARVQADGDRSCRMSPALAMPYGEVELRVAATRALWDLKWAEQYANADFQSTIVPLEAALKDLP